MRFGAKRVTATVTTAEGAVLVTPDDEMPFDRLMFERRFDIEWLMWDSIREEYLIFLAWVQLNRAALAAKELSFDDFDTWMLGVAEVEFAVLGDEGDDAVVPTVPTASTT